MKACETFIGSFATSVGSSFSIPVIVKEDAVITDLKYQTRIDSEFLNFNGVSLSAKFSGASVEIDALEGADKETMQKLTIAWNSGEPVNVCEGEVVCYIQFQANKEGDTYLKFLNNLPKFPSCDCWYFGGDYIMMEEDEETWGNGHVVISA